MTAISTVAARILVIKQRNIEPAQHTLSVMTCSVSSSYILSNEWQNTLLLTKKHLQWSFVRVGRSKSIVNLKSKKEELTRAKRRLEEPDRLIGGLYENYMTGTLPEKQYRSLMKRYSDEQAELDKRTVELTELLQAKTASVNDIERFIKIIKKYKEPTSLNADMARELIDKIVIHETVGRKKDRQQQVDIYYNFIGQFDFAPTEEEIREAKIKAEQELAEKRAFEERACQEK